MNRITEERENILHRNVEVVIDEEIKLAPDTVLLAPSDSAHRFDRVVEIGIDEVKLKEGIHDSVSHNGLYDISYLHNVLIPFSLEIDELLSFRSLSIVSILVDP